jgi:hypothetical protein
VFYRFNGIYIISSFKFLKWCGTICILDATIQNMNHKISCLNFTSKRENYIPKLDALAYTVAYPYSINYFKQEKQKIKNKIKCWSFLYIVHIGAYCGALFWVGPWLRWRLTLKGKRWETGFALRISKKWRCWSCSTSQYCWWFRGTHLIVGPYS